MHRRIRSGMSEPRKRWLIKLVELGPQERPRGPVGFYCMNLGWTTWVVRDRQTGQRITLVEAIARYGPWISVHCDRGHLEDITEAGKNALKEAGYDCKDV
jgi:hypothetical protein